MSTVHCSSKQTEEILREMSARCMGHDSNFYNVLIEAGRNDENKEFLGAFWLGYCSQFGYL